MIENVLTLKNASVKVKVTVKTLVSLGVIALAVILPQIFHLAVGGTSGMTYLPMYLPVLIGGCLLGAWWGLGVGVASPVVSFLITLAFGNPMPALARLPFMAAELAAMAAITGAFSGAIAKNGWMAFPAVLLALVGGRLLFWDWSPCSGPCLRSAWRSCGRRSGPDSWGSYCGRSSRRLSLWV